MGLLDKNHRNCSWGGGVSLKTWKSPHNNQLCIWYVSCVHLGLTGGNGGEAVTSAVTGLAQAPWGSCSGRQTRLLHWPVRPVGIHLLPNSQACGEATWGNRASQSS